MKERKTIKRAIKQKKPTPEKKKWNFGPENNPLSR